MEIRNRWIVLMMINWDQYHVSITITELWSPETQTSCNRRRRLFSWHSSCFWCCWCLIYTRLMYNNTDTHRWNQESSFWNIQIQEDFLLVPPKWPSWKCEETFKKINIKTGNLMLPIFKWWLLVLDTSKIPDFQSIMITGGDGSARQGATHSN